LASNITASHGEVTTILLTPSKSVRQNRCHLPEIYLAVAGYSPVYNRMKLIDLGIPIPKLGLKRRGTTPLHVATHSLEIKYSSNTWQKCKIYASMRGSSCKTAAEQCYAHETPHELSSKHLLLPMDQSATCDHVLSAPKASTTRHEDSSRIIL
jgi:hypothetical protein